MSQDIENLQELKDRVEEFIRDRDWEKYHDPKNIAESISIEAAELLEEFQWKTQKESKNLEKGSGDWKAVEEEVADVIIYCLSLANQLDIDLKKAVIKKLELNEEKYPIEKVKEEL